MTFNWKETMRFYLATFLLCGLSGSYTNSEKGPLTILALQPETFATAAAGMTEGDQFFLSQDGLGAVLQPALAEAHDNWAWLLDHMGGKSEAEKRYLDPATGRRF